MEKGIYSFLLVSVLLFPPTLALGLSGSGTEADPYRITSFEDFEEFRAKSSYWRTGVHTRLETDLDLDPRLPGRTVYPDAVIGPYNGSSLSTFYSGVFDGANHRVSNLSIYQTNGSWCTAFFGEVTGAKIKNLRLQNISVSGTQKVAGLIGGCFQSQIFGCSVVGTITGTHTTGGLIGSSAQDTISNCFASCTMSVTSYAGGLIGRGGSTIHDCYARGNISSDDGCIGGFLGQGWGSSEIWNCYAAVDIVDSTVEGAGSTGGFVGELYSYIYDCFATGNISVQNSYGAVGGFCGFFPGDLLRAATATGKVRNESGSGGISAFCGFISSNQRFIDCYYLYRTDGPGDTYATPRTSIPINNPSCYIYEHWDFVNTWTMSGGYPVLQCFMSTDAKVILVAKESLTSQDRVSITPESMNHIPEAGGIFYVELWASDIGETNTGISGVYVDLGFSTEIEILSLHHSDTFNLLPSGTIGSHEIINFGGAGLPHGGGIEPEWTRIGWVKGKLLTKPLSMAVNIIHEDKCSVAAFGRGKIPWSLVVKEGVDIYNDCNGNGISDEIDIAKGTSRDCNRNGIPDECDIASGLCQDCNRNGVPDECDIANGTSTDEGGDGVPDECQAVIEIVPVAVADPPYYTPETRTELPTSITQVGRSSKYYLELWAQCREETSIGLLSFSIDIPYDSFSSVLSLHHNTLVDDPNGFILPDRVDDFGGQFSEQGQGMVPEWVRLGWLEMRANLETDSSTISLLPGDERIEEYGGQDVPWEYVTMHDLNMEILPPLRSYDLDYDSWIGLGDLSFFAVSWEQTVPPADEMHDFDFDGLVGPGDLSWFVTGWNKNVDDMSIVYSPYYIQPPMPSGPSGFPSYMPSESRSGIDKVTIDTGLSQPPSDPQNEYLSPPALTDVAVAASLIDTASPSDASVNLPQSVESIAAGNQYVLEFWVSDVGQVNSGITSVYVNAEYLSSVFSVQKVSYGSVFNLFTQGATSEAMVENLGGSTLDPGIGIEPYWVRFAIVEVTALSDKDVFSIDLLPSQLGIAAYGRGKVPWGFVHLIPLRSYFEGDLNSDGRVNLIDLGIMARPWKTHMGDPSWCEPCDLNKDDSVDLGDIVRLVEHWLKEE